MAVKSIGAPSNTNWVRETISSPNMQKHLSSLPIRELWVKLIDNAIADGGAPGAFVGRILATIEVLGELQVRASKTGVYDTDSPYFRGAVKAYVFNYRIRHPIRTIEELPALLRRGLRTKS
ncbi:MAG: hypothetical protein ACHQX1_02755 [Candidatus Micrarchaeales archaeon]